MKYFNILILLIFFTNNASAENHLKFYLKSAFENNLQLNAERKNQKSIKENINISRSEFLPSISFSNDQSSSQSSNKTNHNGSKLSDSSLDSENQLYPLIRKSFKDLKDTILLKSQN